MGLFKIGKRRDEIIDYTKGHKKPSEKQESTRESTTENSYNPVAFFDNLSSSVSENNSHPEVSEDNSLDIDERKKRLAKRIADMTDRLEELSNQIYRLSQRVELIERKIDIKDS